MISSVLCKKRCFFLGGEGGGLCVKEFLMRSCVHTPLGHNLVFSGEKRRNIWVRFSFVFSSNGVGKYSGHWCWECKYCVGVVSKSKPAVSLCMQVKCLAKKSCFLICTGHNCGSYFFYPRPSWPCIIVLFDRFFFVLGHHGIS